MSLSRTGALFKKKTKLIIGEGKTYIGQHLHKNIIYLIICISIFGNSWCYPGVIYYTSGEPLWPKEQTSIWDRNKDLNRF